MRKKITAFLPICQNMGDILDPSAVRYNSDNYLELASPVKARELSTYLFENGITTSQVPASDLYAAAWICTAWDSLLNIFSDDTDSYANGIIQYAEKEILQFRRSLNEIDKSIYSPKKKPIRDNERKTKETEKLLNKGSLHRLAQIDPAFSPFSNLFQQDNQNVRHFWQLVEDFDKSRQARPPENRSPLQNLRRPIEVYPHSIQDQLTYIIERWGTVLGDWLSGALRALDMLKEEKQSRSGGAGESHPPDYSYLSGGGKVGFSRDDDWMPKVVMMAKNALVWLSQLSEKYNRPIYTLDSIPDEELHSLSVRGFTALWLIGIWKRSNASREIKRRMGNPDAQSSAYSLDDYSIAEELGGHQALIKLQERAWSFGIRLSSDMVPNHVGIDSDWVRNNPDWLMHSSYCPFPSYTFNSENLSNDSSLDIHLEDHYWNHSDAAVVFKRTDKNTGDTRYVYHGNDGTTMPWNDTAQIDFLNPEAREAVIQKILYVAKLFPIIRFDAAMVLASRHIRRLWYPAPGSGGAIPSRSENSISDQEFVAALPQEFWREVVERIASENTGTLLLAEAFWMLEGYFVRELGMHRVYNSAFMNMLRDGKNGEYRQLIKDTLAFDPGILQRFVNFMSNPDEETAINQFGDGDRYFATCTLLSTLPGLPMFGHGQIEGFMEKYGMEYGRAYKNESPNQQLLERHEKTIFPLLSRRYLFSSAYTFRLFDFMANSSVNENIFAYTNSTGSENAVTIVNNSFERSSGFIHISNQTKIDEQLITTSISEIVASTSLNDSDWLILHDSISGLWFIRAISELKSNGLWVDIEGYTSIVFIESRIVEDSSLWRDLAAHLGRAGTHDIDALMDEIRLKPFYSSVDNLVWPDLFPRMAESIQKGVNPVIRKIYPELEERFAETLRVRESKGLKKYAAFHGDGHLFDDLQEKLDNATRFLNKTTVLKKIPPASWNDATFLAIASFFNAITNVLMTISKESFSSSWAHWRFDKYIPSESTPIKAALSASKWASGFNKTQSRHLVKLLTHPFMRNSLEFNHYDGIIWYTEEGWNSTMRALILYSGIHSPKGFRSWLQRIRLRIFMRKWQKAHLNSQYHFDTLIKALR